jgi:hypothetical protein
MCKTAKAKYLINFLARQSGATDRVRQGDRWPDIEYKQRVTARLRRQTERVIAKLRRH